MQSYTHFRGYIGDMPSSEKEYDALEVCPPNTVIWDTEVAAKPTWTELQAKQQELNDAEADVKANKVSAYKKLSMTDAEINAIDPTLLGE